jgi:hypothetical protein
MITLRSLDEQKTKDVSGHIRDSEFDFDRAHRRFQLRSFSLRCFAFYRNCAEHRLTHHPPVNPQLPRDASDRSTTMLVLPSNLLVKLHLGSPVHQSSLGVVKPEAESTAYGFQ